MKVTEKDVAYVADLSNLELTEEERAHMVRDLNSILGYIDRLNQLDTSDVEPMAQVSDRYGVDASKLRNERFASAAREDVLFGLRPSLPHQEALANAEVVMREWIETAKELGRPIPEPKGRLLYA